MWIRPILLFLCLAGSICAQDTPPGVTPPGFSGIVPFLEPSYITTPTKRLFFEGQIATHFTILRNFTDTLREDRPHDNWAILFTPGIVARMFKENSNPVRTPSYMPRLDVQQLWGLRYSPPRTEVSFWEWHGAIGHHSNGQEECPFIGQTADPDTGICIPSYADRSRPGTINMKNGSFSTNYVRGGINFRRSYLDPQTKNTNADFTLGLEYQRQMMTDPDIRPFYPQHRVRGQIAWSWRDTGVCNRLQTELVAGVAVDHPVPDIGQWSLAPKIVCFPFRESDIGIYLKVLRGPDYYNLNFLETTKIKFHVGIEFSQDGFFRFEPITETSP